MLEGRIRDALFLIGYGLLATHELDAALRCERRAGDGADVPLRS